MSALQHPSDMLSSGGLALGLDGRAPGLAQRVRRL
jgi:hypothetical protein